MSEENKAIQTPNKPTARTDFVSGMFSGAICSLIFNPWDRGIYLSVKHNRSFFNWDNFSKPYHGAGQAMFQRAFLGSGYYLVQGQIRSHSAPYLHSLGMPTLLVHVVTGLAAGTTHGLMTNSAAVVKAHTWGNESLSLRSSVAEMYKAAGLKIFAKGMGASIARDAVHGSTYELFRHLLRNKAKELQPEVKELSYSTRLACDAAAAFLGTAASAPFNHARTLKFATLPHLKPPTIPEVWTAVWNESNAHSKKRFGRVRFFQKRFCVGLGTGRAAAGMALGQQIFDYLRLKL